MFRSPRSWTWSADFSDNSLDIEDYTDSDNLDLIPEEIKANTSKSPFSSDALAHSREFDEIEQEYQQKQSYPPQQQQQKYFEYFDASSGSKIRNLAMGAPTKGKKQGAKGTADDGLQQQQIQKSDLHVDAAEKIYATAKGVWAWGKGLVVVSTFLGIAEGVAGKALSIAGTNLEAVDNGVLHHLHGIDDGLLNPAIAAVVGTFLGAMHKTEEIFKPVVFAVLKPIGVIKDEESSNNNKKSSEEKHKDAPELTTKPVPMVH